VLRHLLSDTTVSLYQAVEWRLCWRSHELVAGGAERTIRYFNIQTGARRCDPFHIAAVGDLTEMGKRMLCENMRLGMQFNDHGELDGESPRYRCENMF
jgi:hypothetical protein